MHRRLHLVATAVAATLLALSGCTGTIEDGPASPDAGVGPDGVPSQPGWVDSSTLTATGGPRQVFLTWTPAGGDVVAYRVFVDGSPYEDVVGSRELLVANLNADTEYTFKVEAGFDGDEWTTDGPSATARTDDEYDPGFRRLSEEQFNRTVADLHGYIWTRGCDAIGCDWPRDSEEWYRIITTQNYGYWQVYQTGYPTDQHTGEPAQPRGGYRRLDQIVFDEHIAFWLGATMEIAGDVYEGWVGDRIVFDPCQQDNDAGLTNFATNEEVWDNCMVEFVDDFGMRAFRRPLTDVEHTFFMDIYRDTGVQYAADGLEGRALAERGLRNVMAVIMSSPEFLYRIELGDEDGNITPYELASRLSFHFWNTMPDEELLAAAADGSLMTDAGYATQVDRLFDSPRAVPVIDEFYRDFFRVQDFADISVQDGPSSYHGGPNYQQYGNGLSAVLAAMQDEMANLGQWFTKTRPGTFEDMFRSNLHFLQCQFPAWADDQCYGAGPWSEWSYGIDSGCTSDNCPGGGWDGTSEPTTLPEPQRVGLLTRLGVLGHDTVNHRPIRRGLYIREALLCDPIPPPENCDVVKPPELDVYMTVRDKVEAITEQPGTTCAGCHATLINGFGHALNHFSSKGQYWDKEHMFTDQQNAEGEYWWFLAEEADWADIDATGETMFINGMVTINGAQDLADVLADSGRMEYCWSREYFRFALGRLEWDADEAAIEGLANQLRQGSTLAEGFRAVAHTPQFKTLVRPAPAQEGTP